MGIHIFPFSAWLACSQNRLTQLPFGVGGLTLKIVVLMIFAWFVSAHQCIQHSIFRIIRHHLKLFALQNIAEKHQAISRYSQL